MLAGALSMLDPLAPFTYRVTPVCVSIAGDVEPASFAENATSAGAPHDETGAQLSSRTAIVNCNLIENSEARRDL